MPEENDSSAEKHEFVIIVGHANVNPITALNAADLARDRTVDLVSTGPS